MEQYLARPRHRGSDGKDLVDFQCDALPVAGGCSSVSWSPKPEQSHRNTWPMLATK